MANSKTCRWHLALNPPLVSGQRRAHISWVPENEGLSTLERPMTTQPKPRYRQKDTITQTAFCQEWARGTSCGHTLWSANSAEFPIKTGTFVEMHDTVVPNFKKRQGKGEVFFNPMSILKREYSNGYHAVGKVTSFPKTCNSPEMWAEYELRGNWLPHILHREVVGNHSMPQYAGLILPKQVNSMQKEVSTGTWNARGRSDNNLWESLAELNRTIDMLYIPLSKLDRLVKTAQRAHRSARYLGYTKDGVSNLWLKYRYGIRPIISDVEGIVKGLQQRTGRQRRTSRDKESESQSKTLTFTASHGVVRFHIQNDVKHTLIVRGMSLDEMIASMLSNIGFTTKGLLTLPWELFSYSFVYDWIINFGDYLGAVTPAFGWNQLGSTMTTKHVIENSFKITGAESTHGNYGVSTQPHGTYYIKVEGKTRTPLMQPGLVVKNDFGFNKPTRLADAAALLAQRFSRTFR